MIAYQGRTFPRLMTWKIDGMPVDLTGFDARMQVRETLGAAEPLLELTKDNGRIVLGGSAGTIQLLVAAADMSLDGGFYVYDFEVEDGAGVVTPLLEGPFTVVAEITR